MWNFKGTLWNSTQNILPIHWKIWFLYNTDILRALRFKSSYAFLNAPPFIQHSQYQCCWWHGKLRSEWLHLTAFLGTVDSKVHIVHISHVITAYTLESLSTLTKITHNLQATINFKKKIIKQRTTKKWGHILSWQIIGEIDSGSGDHFTKKVSSLSNFITFCKLAHLFWGVTGVSLTGQTFWL